MPEQRDRRDEGNEPYVRANLGERKTRRERVADNSKDCEGSKGIPKLRWKWSRRLPSGKNQEAEGGEGNYADKSVDFDGVKPMTHSLALRRNRASTTEKGKGPYTDSPRHQSAEKPLSTKCSEPRRQR